MKLTKLRILAGTLLLFSVSCSSLLLNPDRVRLQVIRVVGALELEVIMQGRRQIVSLYGITIINKEEFLKNYIESGKMPEKYKSEMLKKINSSLTFLGTLVSPGDTLYAIVPDSKSRSIRARPVIIYMPNLVSINEIMVNEGHAFPTGFNYTPRSEDRFQKDISNAYMNAVKSRNGLWRIGILHLNSIQNKTKR